MVNSLEAEHYKRRQSVLVESMPRRTSYKLEYVQKESCGEFKMPYLFREGRVNGSCLVGVYCSSRHLESMYQANTEKQFH